MMILDARREVGRGDGDDGDKKKAEAHDLKMISVGSYRMLLRFFGDEDAPEKVAELLRMMRRAHGYGEDVRAAMSELKQNMRRFDVVLEALEDSDSAGNEDDGVDDDDGDEEEK